MRVLNLITGLGYGGAERLLLNSSIALRDRIEIVNCFVKCPEHLAGELSRVSTVVKMPEHGGIRFLQSLIRYEGIDLLHTHLIRSDFLGFLANYRSHIPAMCTLHNVWTWHNYKDELAFSVYRTLLHTIARRWTVIGISRSVHDHAIKRLGMPAARVKLIPNGVPDIKAPLDREQARQKLNICARDFVILFVGRLSEEKNIGTLLQAVQRMNDNSRLLILGEGKMRARLGTLVQRLNLQRRVEFRGVSGNPENYFQAADVMALPSLYEGFSLVIVEAFRAGIPVVATNQGGPAELIQAQHNGLLVAPMDVEALSRALLRLKHNPDERTRMGANGRIAFTEKYQIEKYAETLYELYCSKLSEKAAP
jgi:glycosyltransferase involved in cell wall biosynthesis